MKRILVTGSTGLLGAEVVRALLVRTRFAEVIALARDPALATELAAAGATVVAGSLDRGGLADASRLAPFDAVIHCAADVRWHLPAKAARAANVVTTECLLEHARRWGSAKLIAVSTAALTIADPGGFINTYEESKAETEALIRSSGVPYTIIRPSLIVGRTDTGAANRTNRGVFSLFKLLYQDQLPFVVGRPDSPVDVVSTDTCAASIIHGLDCADCEDRTWTLAEGSNAMTLSDFLLRIHSAFRNFGIERDPVSIVVPRSWRRLYRRLMLDNGSRLDNALVHVCDTYEPYLSRGTRMAPDLCPRMVSPRPFRSYLTTAVKGWLEHEVGPEVDWLPAMSKFGADRDATDRG